MKSNESCFYSAFVWYASLFPRVQLCVDRARRGAHLRAVSAPSPPLIQTSLSISVFVLLLCAFNLLSLLCLLSYLYFTDWLTDWLIDPHCVTDWLPRWLQVLRLLHARSLRLSARHAQQHNRKCASGQCTNLQLLLTISPLSRVFVFTFFVFTFYMSCQMYDNRWCLNW